MATTTETSRGHIVGFVRGVKKQKDGNTRFRIAVQGLSEEFLVRTDSRFARVLQGAKRACVVYRRMPNVKYPKILDVLANPTGLQVSYALAYQDDPFGC